MIRTTDFGTDVVRGRRTPPSVGTDTDGTRSDRGGRLLGRRPGLIVLGKINLPPVKPSGRGEKNNLPTYLNDSGFRLFGTSVISAKDVVKRDYVRRGRYTTKGET